MSKLLETMSADMKIRRFHNETPDSFVYRLCYSALGQWCLSIGRNKIGANVGTSKHNQTIVLNELLKRYIELFPTVADRFIDPNQPFNVSYAIRRTYEETGYFITDENNQNSLADYGRSIKFGDQSLIFGLPQRVCAINGLGVFSEATAYEVTLTDFLIRDNLDPMKYFDAQFDPIDFYERDIDLQELEIFNPLSNSVPSQSWDKQMATEYSMARRFETGPFYKVMRTPTGVMFADVPIEVQNDNFTSYEYRRLYFAMKRVYGNPLRVRITKLDEFYSRIRLGGHLPNREYYLMLLLSWPERSAFDKVNFIIKNSLLEPTKIVLENIGLRICGGNTRE